MNTATVEIAEAEDVIDQVRAMTPTLEGIARSAKQGMRKGSEDRFVAGLLCEAALRLAMQLKGYAAALAGLKHREIEGFAIGFQDATGKVWFLHHALHWGNLMRTDRPEGAAIWPTTEALREWARDANQSKGEDDKGKPWPSPFVQLDAYDLHAYRVRVEVGEPVALIRRKIRAPRLTDGHTRN